MEYPDAVVASVGHGEQARPQGARPVGVAAAALSMRRGERGQQARGGDGCEYHDL